MGLPRKAVVFEDAIGVYHVISRCVRRAFLCGLDPLTGMNYEHRRGWVRDHLRFLSENFFMDIYAYAVMSNHMHIVLRSNPMGGRDISDDEVVRRWKRVCPGRRGCQVELSDKEVRELSGNSYQVNEWRQRLGNLSWFMRCLNEKLARDANREDECTGRFWEGRFKCQRLADEGAVLACMAYVDLNPVRAGMAEGLEDSRFTSIYDRILARRAEKRLERITSLQEIRETEAQKQKVALEKRRIGGASWLYHFSETPTEEYGRPCISEEDYLMLVDTTGRCIRAGKGRIPPQLESVLERVDLDCESWVENIKSYGSLFYYIAGKSERLLEAAKVAGIRWFCQRRAKQCLYCCS